MNQRISILILAATYVGTVVGAGFLTGKEIVTFFSLNGALGTFGIAVSGFLFIVIGSKVFKPILLKYLMNTCSALK